jgi:hypothetical protein
VLGYRQGVRLIGTDFENLIKPCDPKYFVDFGRKIGQLKLPAMLSCLFANRNQSSNRRAGQKLNRCEIHNQFPGIFSRCEAPQNFSKLEDLIFVDDPSLSQPQDRYIANGVNIELFIVVHI